MAVCLKASDLGTSCLVTARESYSIIVSKDRQGLKESILKLQSLEDTGAKLVELSVEQREVFEGKTTYYQSQFEDLQGKKAEMEIKKMELDIKRSSLESSAKDYKRALDQAKDREHRAEEELREAQDKLQSAKNEEESKRKKGVIGGAIAGFMVGGPLGAVYGGVVGSAVSHIVNEAQGRVERADKRIKERRNEVSDAHDRVNSANSTLQKTQMKIDFCCQEIIDIDESIDEIHDHIGVLKESTAFAMKAAHLWELFTMACQSATRKTENLKNVIMIAEERAEYRILRSDGTITKVNSFLEGWEAITSHKALQEACIEDDDDEQ